MSQLREERTLKLKAKAQSKFVQVFEMFYMAKLVLVAVWSKFFGNSVTTVFEKLILQSFAPDLGYLVIAELILVLLS